MKMTHPYENYKNNELWQVVEKALDDLVENQDIVLQTVDDYVIGYIVKTIIDSNDKLTKDS